MKVHVYFYSATAMSWNFKHKQNDSSFWEVIIEESFRPGFSEYGTYVQFYQFAVKPTKRQLRQLKRMFRAEAKENDRIEFGEL